MTTIDIRQSHARRARRPTAARTGRRTLVIFGCGAQARYVLENLGSQGGLGSVALVDVVGQSQVGASVNGAVVRWTCEQALDELDPTRCRVIVAHGDNTLKLRLARTLETKGFQYFSAVHRQAMISPTAEVAAGCIINPGAVILPNAVIERHAIVHSGAVVEHDCRIGRGANLGPGAQLAGRVRVGEGAYLYTGCCVAPDVTIGPRAVVGAGAVVLKDVPEAARVVGNPAKVIA